MKCSSEPPANCLCSQTFAETLKAKVICRIDEESIAIRLTFYTEI